ncbi:PAQR family membrane homeostasis protein TrhA [Macrococcus capreoli]|uniref:PAQR family membrane homeostasis protein TrhA n=1 Tax=Macrococcus capreoli TaxID=2982690 RepID=UPI0021D59F3F|nr:hemolysin III family protein [Macrococcus sp. TMW 2.2395]MCU7557480.1 hemolysin III family protein [Macrococcus sp. TMW 2.2395]
MKPKSPQYNFRDIKELKLGEEVGNSVSHGIPALLILFTLPYFSIKTFMAHGTTFAFGISIFLISILLMFLSSAIYHLMPPKSIHKYVMRIIDHAMIYIAIAGTYTPIALSLVGGTLGWGIMIVEWLITIGGIVYKSTAKNVNPKISLAIYLIMGWLGVILFPSLVTKASWLFISFIVLGGIMYSVGAWFYAQKHRHYFHMIWHFFILAGAGCHFIALLYFIK